MRLFSARRATNETSYSETDAFLAAMDKTLAIAWFDLTGKVIKANALFCDMLEYAVEDIVGVPHSAFVEVDKLHSKAETAYLAALKDGKASTDTVPRHTKSGRKLWLEATYLPIAGADGDITRIAKIARDVTTDFEATQSQVQQYSAISDQNAIIIFGLDGTIIEANKNFTDTMGYTREEIIGKKHRMFVHEEYGASEKYTAFWQHVSNGDSHIGIFKRFKKDGSAIWLQSIYTPVFDTDGKQVSVIKTARDVTAQEIATNQVSEENEDQAMIEFDLQGVVRNASKAFLDAVGYSLEEIRGKHHRIFMFDEDAAKPEYAEHWAHLVSGQYHMGEFRRRRKNGEELWISATYAPVFGPDGKPVKIVKSASDITPRIKAVKYLRAAIGRLSNGDLSQSIHEEFSPEFEAVRQDFNAAQMHLRKAISDVVHSTQEIHSGTSEISKATGDLSSRTESQAAALEQTAAAVREMAASVKSTSDISDRTQDLVVKAKSHTQASTGVMSEARSAMDAISTSSDEISQITSVIEDIAFQTNLLALNAGVEAARAGEAGRGFAVVASEVRALALRSSEAATRIAALIATSAGQVEQGVGLVSKTSESLSDINGFVTEIDQMVASIATAAREQAAGLTEINSAIGNLDEVTQKNAAMFEETNAATQLLSNEVQSLSGTTQAFQLSEETKNTNADSVQKLAS